MSVIPHENPKHTQLARWLARGLSLLIIGFILMLLIFNEDFRDNPTLATVMYWALAFSILIAWRWEKFGGLLTLLLIPVFLLTIIFQWSTMVGIITPIWQLVLIGVSMMIPFLIVGTLFLYVGRKSPKG